MSLNLFHLWSLLNTLEEAIEDSIQGYQVEKYHPEDAEYLRDLIADITEQKDALSEEMACAKQRHPLPPHSRVEIMRVDLSGFQGREIHPSPDMLGMRGRVVRAYREEY